MATEIGFLVDPEVSVRLQIRVPEPEKFRFNCTSLFDWFSGRSEVSTVHVEGFSGLGRAPGSPETVYGWQQWQHAFFHSGSPPIKALHVDDRPSMLHRLPHR